MNKGKFDNQRLSTVWLNKLPMPEEDFRKVLKANATNPVLVQLRTIIQDKIKELSNLEIAQEQYDCPNWQYKVADQSGQKRTLKQIDNLLSWVYLQ
jgi:hypothetical protein